MNRFFLYAVFIVLVVFRVDAAPATAPAAFENQLANHPSPYLAMHGHDPVHWQVWGKAAVQLAKKLNRPLYISSGYFSCRWCHVMQRESYQDPAVAALLNHYFVPVKVDRELEPALDAHLIEFVQLTRGSAGWPLNVFLTPEGYPMLGMTYLPKDQFLSVLKQMKERWQSGPDELRRIAQDALVEWQGMRNADHASDKTPLASPAPLGPKLVAQAGKLMDEMSGGFGQQNKFPMTPQLKALLDVRRQGKPDKHLDNFLRLTLDKMARQGMHDLVGGGFFRYVVDPNWQVPHYEKMLYDNTQLVSLYLQAASDFRDAGYRDTAFETLDFLLSDMWRANHFISSFSAVDGQGREGAYYLWTDEELKKLLSKDEFRLVKLAWFDNNVARSAWGKLPRWQMTEAELVKRTGKAPAALHRSFARIRQKLLKARKSRSLPADGKGLAAWNGLALTALADAVEAGGDAKYRHHGDQLADYLAKVLWDGERLVRALNSGRVLADASLQDYALVAKGLQDWGRVSGDRQYTQLAGRLARIAWARYYRKGRWLETDAPLIPMLNGKVALDDNPLPSATALVTGVSLTNKDLKQDKKIRQAVSDHLARVRARLSDSIFWYASYVEWLDRNPG